MKIKDTITVVPVSLWDFQAFNKLNTMKKIIVSILIFLVLIIPTYALDLSDYPSFFVKDNDLDVILVVGDKAPASDVLAQTQVALSLAQFGNALGISKLASEIEYEEQNIISIGSPCYNPVTEEIMGNPVPCDKELTDGKAFIRMYQHNDNVQIVIIGYNDGATREMANILRDYQEHELKGNEYIINLKPEEEIVEPEEVKEEIIEVKEEIKEESKETEETPQKNVIEVEPKEPPIEKELNIIVKIIIWLKDLFRIR